MKCRRCGKQAEIELRSHHTAFCRDCFKLYFLRQVKRAIKEQHMFSPRERILVAVSGGKDSLTLWHILLELGYNASGLFVDLKIGGFSEHAREKVEKFAQKRDAKLIIVDLEKEGIPIPKVVKKTGKEPCAICGQVKRYFFNRIAYEQKFHILATGHNLDDETSRLLANLLRWQMSYLVDQGPVLPPAYRLVKKVKPLYRLTEYEIAAYAFINNIDYFAGKCPFSKGATFLRYKHYINQIEYEFPGTKLDFYQGFLKKMKPFLTPFQREETTSSQVCPRCGYPTLAPLCGICRLKEEIEKAG